jgi:hypothetical protein
MHYLTLNRGCRHCSNRLNLIPSGPAHGLVLRYLFRSMPFLQAVRMLDNLS